MKYSGDCPQEPPGTTVLSPRRLFRPSCNGILEHPTVTVNCSDERSIPPCREAGNPAVTFHQYPSTNRSGRIFRANHDEPCCVLANRSDLSSSVTEALVFRNCNPAPLGNKSDPVFVWCIDWKMVVMHLDFDPLLSKPIRDDVFPQTAVWKESGLVRLRVGSHTGSLPRFPTLHARSLPPTGSRIHPPCSARQ